MKYIKKFKLIKETGEWNRNIDLDYVKENPDDDSEEANWIKYLLNLLEDIINDLSDPNVFKIIDIRVFDLYQGPYAIVKIFDKNYKISIIDNTVLWIDNFPVDNTSSYNTNPGFQGRKLSISKLLNQIIEAGGIEVYKNTKKYNL